MSRSPSQWLLHRHHAANQTLRHLAEDKHINFSEPASLSTAELCRSWIKRRRCAAPGPAALRAGHAAPTAPTRRGAAGTNPRSIRRTTADVSG
jgi:hypothetical protein